MSDFTRYRLVKQPRKVSRCQVCRGYLDGPAVRMNGICGDAYGKAFLTLWLCLECHKDHTRGLYEKANRTGLAWCRADAERAAKVIPLELLG
jgi:hypothetical protein